MQETADAAASYFFARKTGKRQSPSQDTGAALLRIWDLPKNQISEFGGKINEIRCRSLRSQDQGAP